MTTRIAAHRGGAALWPENSLLAFQSAIALGSDLLEFDVHMTPRPRRRGDPRRRPRAHDRRAPAPVLASSGADLGRLRLRGPDKVFSGEHVPTLDEMLASSAPGPGAAHRGEGAPRPALDTRDWKRSWPRRAVGAPGARHRHGVRPPCARARARARAASPPAAPLERRRPRLGSAAARAASRLGAAAAGATDLGLDHTLVDEQLVAAAHAANLALGVWTVNDPEAIRRMLDLGVDIITSDRPDLAKRLQRGGLRAEM